MTDHYIEDLDGHSNPIGLLGGIVLVLVVIGCILLFTACQDKVEQPAVNPTNPSSAVNPTNPSWTSWGICPATTKDMTEYQKFKLRLEHNMVGKRFNFVGTVDDVRYDFMDDMPIVLLRNPNGVSGPSSHTTLDWVWARLPKDMRELGLEIKKGERVNIYGEVLGECMETAYIVYIDVAVYSFQRMDK